jgi:hypothetical protein
MQKPRLLDQVRQVCRVRNYSPRTEKTYIQRLWMGCPGFSLRGRAAF